MVLEACRRNGTWGVRRIESTDDGYELYKAYELVIARLFFLEVPIATKGDEE